jgi:lipoate-protein ligase A
MWRFLPIEKKHAALNMAVDEAILNNHLKGNVPPTLRLYYFSPPAVSLGYAQSLPPETVAHIEERGFDVVRRPTGGRAVLHLNDLTYSFVASVNTSVVSVNTSENGVLAGSIQRAYKQICEALIFSIGHLGLSLEIGRGSGSYKNQADCFQTTTLADLHHNGKKIIGSAQLRRRTAVLQHGSLLLNQPPKVMQELLTGGSTNDGASAPLNESANYSASMPYLNDSAHTTPSGEDALANLFDLLNRTVPDSELNDAFCKGFAQAFDQNFAIGNLTSEELVEAQELEAKYRAGVQKSRLTTIQ